MEWAILLVILTLASGQEERFDSVKVDEVLANRRLLNAYVKCVLDQGRCTPAGKDLRAHISEALQNGCAQCTESQKTTIKKVIGHLINKEPARWKELVKKYDPQGIYASKYESELRQL